jgi:hypothetical protein
MDEQRSVRLGILGAALRRYRVERGLTLDDAAAMLDCDRSKVSRSRREREAAASQVFVYEGQRVPALLRAEGYARVIAEHDPLVPAGTEGRVADVLAARQRAVLGAEQPELVMVIGEAALRQQVGGAKVMREQIAGLAALSADSDRVTILVLPFASGAHAGAGSGPVTIFRFGQSPGLGMVHQAGLSGGIFLDSPGDLDAHAVAFTRLRASALSTEDSARLLCRLAGR